MGTVSGHQLSTFSSPVNGTSPIDANTVRGNDNTIKTSYNAHDADVTIHLQSGAVASRPTASTANQTWLATDTGAVYLYLDTGSAWVEANYLRNTGGAVSGAVTFNGGATVASGQTLTLTGATVAGQPTWSSSQAITLSTAAQPNVTSVGTLTSLTVSGSSSLQGVSATEVASSTQVRFSANTSLTVAGTMGRQSLTGLAIWPASGSSNDFQIYNAAGTQAALAMPTGTSNWSMIAALTVANGLTVSANGITVVAGNSSFAGVLSVGTTVTSGALAGDIVMPLTRGLRSVNVAGTGTVTLIYAGTAGGVLVTAIDANSNALYIDNASTATSASAGAASALPATPAGYLIVNIAGTNRKIPYYAT